MKNYTKKAETPADGLTSLLEKECLLYTREYVKPTNSAMRRTPKQTGLLHADPSTMENPCPRASEPAIR